MFGAFGRKSSNVRAIQLFHELKQQFPTLPDHVVSNCIAQSTSKARRALIKTLEEALAQQEPMGRIQPEDITLPSPTTETSVESDGQKISAESGNRNNKLAGDEKVSPIFFIEEPKCVVIQKEAYQSSPVKVKREMNVEDSNKIEFGGVKFNKKEESIETTAPHLTSVGNSSFYLKRPNTLNLSNVNDRLFNNIQPSGKCSDVHKLLNSELVNKPPRSPQSGKRFANHKNSPTKTTAFGEPGKLASPSEEKKTEAKKETADTPTQTTDTLLGPAGLDFPNPTGVNVSVNVNCSMDVQTSTNAKCVTSLQVVPQQPWCQEVTSPRSYTSVNLTLRPPSSEPQPPIDITSKNSSLTYSTSSFDPQKGLQSKLQITVGPSGGGVSSMRIRPRSSYHPENEMQAILPANRTGSLSDLRDDVPVVVKQQIRIDKLEIELRTEKCRLIAMQQEVASLENAKNNALMLKQEEAEVTQLEKEVKELQEECNRLTQEIDRNSGPAPPVQESRTGFYDNNPYLERNGPLGLGFPTEQITSNHRHPPPYLQHQQSFNNDGPKWNCHMCTFQNHPLLDRCEQCDMPRILHGRKEDKPRAYQGYQPTNDQTNPAPFLTPQYNGPVVRNYDYSRGNLYSTQYSSPAALAHPRSPRTPLLDPNANLANGLQNSYPSNWPTRAPVVNDRVFNNPYR